MAGWTKLFSSIVTSSVWCEDDRTLRVWVAMLATANADGIVEGSIPGFANLARVSTEELERAIGILSSPDPYSRTEDNDGRRIEAIAGGWQVLNYKRYRERSQEQPGSRAEYFRRYRARNTRNIRNSDLVARNTEAEAEADTTTACPEPEKSPASGPPPALTFPCNGQTKTWALVQRQLNRWSELYAGVDVLFEARKALAWIEANPTRRKTARGMPRFLTSWIARANDSPRSAAARRPTPPGPATPPAYVPQPRPTNCVPVAKLAEGMIDALGRRGKPKP